MASWAVCSAQLLPAGNKRTESISHDFMILHLRVIFETCVSFSKLAVKRYSLHNLRLNLSCFFLFRVSVESQEHQTGEGSSAAIVRPKGLPRSLVSLRPMEKERERQGRCWDE